MVEFPGYTNLLFIVGLPMYKVVFIIPHVEYSIQNFHTLTSDIYAFAANTVSRCPNSN